MKDQKAQKILNHIKMFTAKHGFPPSVREICTALKITSTATVSYNLNKLEKQGFIKKLSSKNRAIEIVDEYGKKPNFVQVPLIRKVTAGSPILAVENIEDVFAMPKEMFKQENLFILKVTGSSMIKAGIFDGDMIVVQKQETAKNGNIVVALIDDKTTVKRFFKENRKFRLQPDNDTMDPIIADTVDIVGIVVGSIRKF